MAQRFDAAPPDKATNTNLFDCYSFEKRLICLEGKSMENIILFNSFQQLHWSAFGSLKGFFG